MSIDLFAGIRVTDYAAGRTWYERLFGSPPSFIPTDTEAVWELAEHRFVFIEQRPDQAGHARHLVFVDDLDALVAQVAERGLAPAEWETYASGVRKAAYRDSDGNEFGFGGAPPSWAATPAADQVTSPLCRPRTTASRETRSPCRLASPMSG